MPMMQKLEFAQGQDGCASITLRGCRGAPKGKMLRMRTVECAREVFFLARTTTGAGLIAFDPALLALGAAVVRFRMRAPQRHGYQTQYSS